MKPTLILLSLVLLSALAVTSAARLDPALENAADGVKPKKGAGFLTPDFYPKADDGKMAAKPPVPEPVDTSFMPKPVENEGPSKADILLSNLPKQLSADSTVISKGELLAADGGPADQAHNSFERTHERLCAEPTCVGSKVSKDMKPIAQMGPQEVTADKAEPKQNAEQKGDAIAKKLHLE